jgi:3-deoxy-D-manno-octulosonic-acid transferase
VRCSRTTPLAISHLSAAACSRWGGQNLLEACAVGVPVIVGPHTFNFEEATRGAIEAGAAKRVSDVAELGRSIDSLPA